MRLFLIGAALGALLFVVAGCGGGSTPSASEQWAGSACTTIDGWATKMQGYADQVRSAVTSPTAGSATTIQTAVTDGTEATGQLVTDLKALGPPPGDGQASTTVQNFTTKIDQTVETVQSEAQKLQQNPNATQIASSLATISTNVSAAIADAKSTFETLKQSNSELKDGFDKAGSCQQLQKDFG